MPEITREEARKELWHRGNLSWKWYPEQHKINDAFNARSAKDFAGNCSRRLGKTYWALTKCVEQAIKIPKARLKYAMGIRDHLIEFALPAMDDIIKDAPPSIRPGTKLSKFKYEFPKNGSEILLVGLDKNPNGLRGGYTDGVVFEEAALIKKLGYLRDSVVGPMMLYRPDPWVITISTPGVDPEDEFKEVCDRQELLGNYLKLDIYNNTRLTPEEIEEIRISCESETTWRREYLCEFIVESERAILPEWHDGLITEDTRDDFFKYYHHYEAMDIGVRHKTFVIFGHYDFRRATLFIEHSFSLKGSEVTTNRIAELTREHREILYESREGPYRGVADNNNLILLNDLAQNHDIRYFATSKDELHAMVNNVRLWLQNGKIKIHPRNKELIGCIRSGVWDDKRNKFDESKTYGHYDGIAALMYLVRNIDTHTNPIPKLINISPENTHIPDHMLEDDDDSELSKLFDV